VDAATSTLWQQNASAMTSDKVEPVPTIRVINATTFAVARYMTLRHSTDNVCCLNFASATNPGGGFLIGAQAQEEDLTRASGLYSCLLRAPEYYDANRTDNNHSLYQDMMIYSPHVPVFRDDSNALIAEPWKTTIITAPAPNRGAIIMNHPSHVMEIEETF
jgi:uncharacterized protein (TIGR02452 family)